MASDSWSSSTIAWIVLVSGSENTRATRAGARASFANRSGSGDHGTMSMRSPFNSFTTACTRERSEEHTSELQSLAYLVCRLLLEKKKKKKNNYSVFATTTRATYY